MNRYTLADPRQIELVASWLIYYLLKVLIVNLGSDVHNSCKALMSSSLWEKCMGYFIVFIQGFRKANVYFFLVFLSNENVLHDVQLAYSLHTVCWCHWHGLNTWKQMLYLIGCVWSHLCFNDKVPNNIQPLLSCEQTVQYSLLNDSVGHSHVFCQTATMWCNW